MEYIALDDRASFVQAFVPLDLSPADADAYLQDLTTAAEAAGTWRNLAAEIAALASGRGVRQIQGDQASRAVFFFEHPLLPGCDREVCFVCSDSGAPKVNNDTTRDPTGQQFLIGGQGGLSN